MRKLIALILQQISILQQQNISLQEVTVEMNPADYSYSELALLKEAGVTKVSFGVQSLSVKELTLSGRRHSPDQALRAIENALKAGFHVVSADLIQGLPAQNTVTWENSVRTLVSTGINHCSVYDLTIEEKTPFHAMKEKLCLPNEKLLKNLDSITT